MIDNQEYIVSVFVVTYNHEEYITQCIESILMQKTNFNFEIVIGEDKSTDNTFEICEQYAAKYDNIKLMTSETNIGYIKNWFRTLKACKGQFIAMCEGDDYWTDANKLQLQYNFLTQNNDYAMCFTNTLLRYEKNGEEVVAKKQIWDVETTNGLLNHNDFITDDNVLPGHTSALMFRNNLITTYPNWLYKVDVLDLPLILMLSKYGKAKFININTSVYRQHSFNLSCKDFSFLTLFLNRIYIYKNLDRYFDYKFYNQISLLLAKYCMRISKIYYFDKNYIYAFKYYFLMLKFDIKFALKGVKYFAKAYSKYKFQN